MYKFAILIPLTVALGLLNLCSFSSAHSWPNNPRSYNRRFLNTCEDDECDRACPPFINRMNNTQANPEKQWQRGQSVRIGWVKNNHRGGFVRFALVPVRSMFSRAAHRQLAFFYGCWDSFQIPCRGEEACGTDRGNEAMAVTVTIPAAYPDGDYVLGHVWFGGLHFSRRHGSFADYWNCAFIRIRGGVPLQNTPATAIYQAGNTGSSVRGDQCHTAVTEPGLCAEDGDCRTRAAFFDKPGPFANNGAGSSFSTADVTNLANGGNPVPMPDAGQPADPPESDEPPPDQDDQTPTDTVPSLPAPQPDPNPPMLPPSTPRRPRFVPDPPSRSFPLPPRGRYESTRDYVRRICRFAVNRRRCRRRVRQLIRRENRRRRRERRRERRRRNRRRRIADDYEPWF